MNTIIISAHNRGNLIEVARGQTAATEAEIFRIAGEDVSNLLDIAQWDRDWPEVGNRGDLVYQVVRATIAAAARMEAEG